MRKIKIGIDVGGTFTHAVAIDVNSFDIIGKSCVPTTHNSISGVAEGVIGSMLTLLKESDISSGEVVLIAHSTTQATNALLEGDVAPVGVIAMGKGFEGTIAKKQTYLNDIFLAPGKKLPVHFRYVEISENLNNNKIESLINELTAEGAKVIVATQAFGPDNNDYEKKIVEIAGKLGIRATAACSLSQLYGLKVRTRTAIVNASMMPKMIETADLTEKAVKESGINAPLMVMRSDGGIMSIDEMRKRPILTMLSGPAAGVAAALMYARISDGIFLEVGGTSTDISVIKNGLPQVKTAKIGRNSLSIKTIDIRTLGVGGGSVPRWTAGKIIDVGPRSAHIANLHYSAYSDNSDFSDIEVEQYQPKQNDPKDYLCIKRKDGNYTLTPSAASYFLGLVSDYGHGSANIESVKNAVNAVAGKIGLSPKSLSENILNCTSQKIEKVIEALVREYKLDRSFLTLVGGGGGASAIVPHAAGFLKLPHSIAKNSEVISAIGAALGMIRDTVERSILNPSEKDIIQIRTEAYESVITMGALPETIEVNIEIDNANKKVIAIATGSSDMKSKFGGKVLTEENLMEIASQSLLTKEKNKILAKTNLLYAIGYKTIKRSFLGLLKEDLQPVVIIDKEGTIRRKFANCKVAATQMANVKTRISELIEEMRSYGDAGELIPDIIVVASGKIIDLSGLIQLSQILSVIELDIKDLPAEDAAIILATRKK